MVLVAGDFWSTGSLESRDDYFRNVSFVAHRSTDEEAEQGLRACDRIDFERGVRTAMRRIYADKTRRAAEAGASGEVRRALEREGEVAVAAVQGFRLWGDEYRWELRRSVVGEDVRSRTFSWEFRRLRDVASHGRRAGVGFERPLPTRQHPGRSHYTPPHWRGILERQGLDGAVPWGAVDERSVYAMALLDPRFQTMRCRTTDEYEERIGYIFLHEVVGHAHGRLRDLREEHADPRDPPSTADKIAMSLARALPGYTTGALRAVDVAWNWDPDLGTYDPLAS